MSIRVAIAKLQEEAGKHEDRKFPRFRAQHINCAKGNVTDFSATGLRIVYCKDMKLSIGDRQNLELSSPRGVLRCEAKVMWTRRISRRHYEVGYNFIDENTHKQIRLFETGFDPLSEGMLAR